LFSAYGPQEGSAALIPELCRSLLDGERPRLTSGDQLWDYVYVADAAEAVLRVGMQPTATGFFNLGSGRVTSIRGVVERVRDLIRPGADLGFGEIALGPDSIRHLEADIDRLRQATGWEPATDLDAGLQKTVAWYRGLPRSRRGDHG
jgi:nucleoside-diphosphate-sugar epimerase